MRNITLGANDSSALVPSESNGVLMKPTTDLRGGLVTGLVAAAALLATAFAVNAETYSSNPHKGLEAKITASLSEGGGGAMCERVCVSSLPPLSLSLCESPTPK